MTESSSENADAVWPHPGSAAERAAEQWRPPADYVFPEDGIGGWGGADPPGAVPGPVAGVEGPHTRPGWLTRARDGASPDGAA